MEKTLSNKELSKVSVVMDLVNRFQDQIKLVNFSDPIEGCCKCTITFKNLLDICPTMKSENLVMAINWFIRKCDAVLDSDTCSDQVRIRFICKLG